MEGDLRAIRAPARETDPHPNLPPSVLDNSATRDLAAYLGPYSAVVQQIAVPDSGIWALALIGLYGPTGTEERMMAPLSSEDRPKALATALLRFQAEGQPWNGRFFKAIMQSVVGELVRGDTPRGPSFGNETERDVARANEARTRASQKATEKREVDEAEADRSMAELWEWWKQLDDPAQKLIEEETAKRCTGLPRAFWKSIQVSVMHEFRARPTGGEGLRVLPGGVEEGGVGVLQSFKVFPFQTEFSAMDEAKALESVSAAALSAASGVPEKTCYFWIRARRLPMRGPNVQKLRGALERLIENPGSGTIERKREVDIELGREKLTALERRNRVESGQLVEVAKVKAAWRVAGSELRSGFEALRRELARACPASDRDHVLDVFDAERDVLVDSVTRALVIE